MSSSYSIKMWNLTQNYRKRELPIIMANNWFVVLLRIFAFVISLCNQLNSWTRWNVAKREASASVGDLLERLHRTILPQTDQVKQIFPSIKDKHNIKIGQLTIRSKLVSLYWAIVNAIEWKKAISIMYSW